MRKWIRLFFLDKYNGALVPAKWILSRRKTVDCSQCLVYSDYLLPDLRYSSAYPNLFCVTSKFILFLLLFHKKNVVEIVVRRRSPVLREIVGN